MCLLASNLSLPLATLYAVCFLIPCLPHVPPPAPTLAQQTTYLVSNLVFYCVFCKWANTLPPHSGNDACVIASLSLCHIRMVWPQQQYLAMSRIWGNQASKLHCPVLAASIPCLSDKQMYLPVFAKTWCKTPACWSYQKYQRAGSYSFLPPDPIAHFPPLPNSLDL